MPPRWLREQRRLRTGEGRRAGPRRRRVAAATGLVVLGVLASIGGLRLNAAAGSTEVLRPSGDNGLLAVSIAVPREQLAVLEALRAATADIPVGQSDWSVDVDDTTSPGGARVRVGFSVIDFAGVGLRLDEPIDVAIQVPKSAVVTSPGCGRIFATDSTPGSGEVVHFAVDEVYDRDPKLPQMLHCKFPAVGELSLLRVESEFWLPGWPGPRDWVGNARMEVVNPYWWSADAGTSATAVLERQVATVSYTLRTAKPLASSTPSESFDFGTWHLGAGEEVVLLVGDLSRRSLLSGAADTLWLLAGVLYGAVPAVILLDDRRRRPRR